MNTETRLSVAVLVYMMVQAVVFFAGFLLVFGTPLADRAIVLTPWVVGLSAVVSAPIAWWIAPRLRARYLHEGARPASRRLSAG